MAYVELKVVEAGTVWGAGLLFIFKRTTMNMKNISAALFLSVFAGAALAGTAYPVEGTFAPPTINSNAVSSTQSVDEDGFTMVNDEYPVDVVTKSRLTRQQVEAQMKLSNGQSLTSLSYAELVFLR